MESESIHILREAVAEVENPALMRLARKSKGQSLRAFSLSNWTKLDVWQYIHHESIPVVVRLPVNLGIPGHAWVAVKNQQMRAVGTTLVGGARGLRQARAGLGFLPWALMTPIKLISRLVLPVWRGTCKMKYLRAAIKPDSSGQRY